MIEQKVDLQKRIGVLGGGQLGRMLQEVALPYGVDLFFLDSDIKAPCSLFKTNFTHGSYRDFNTTIQFGKDKEILTIEIEHVNVEALEQLAKYDIEIIPSVDVIRMIKNKATQKKFYEENDIPTSPYVVVDSKSIPESIMEEWLPCVQKSQLEGYDGKGVKILSSKSDTPYQLEGPSILERQVDIEKELAITIVIDKQLQVRMFPICEMVFDAKLNLVDYLIAPAQIMEHTVSTIHSISNKLAKALNSPGIFSIEFFLTKGGDVLVNEIAPRAHNSAHYTIEGCNISQYEAQLRILLGLPIAEIKMKGYAGMVNLVGEENHHGIPTVENIEKIYEHDQVFLHLYGKKETKPGRKMGHITALNPNREKLIKQLKWLKDNIQIKSISKHSI